MEFPGPVELINYFQKNADPLVTTLSIPCNRPFVRFSIFKEFFLDLFLKNYNFIQFWCVPLLSPELYQNKISQEAHNTDLEVRDNQEIL
jgi:hypothetical protein